MIRVWFSQSYVMFTNPPHVLSSPSSSSCVCLTKINQFTAISPLLLSSPVRTIVQSLLSIHHLAIHSLTQWFPACSFSYLLSPMTNMDIFVWHDRITMSIFRPQDQRLVLSGNEISSSTEPSPATKPPPESDRSSSSSTSWFWNKKQQPKHVVVTKTFDHCSLVEYDFSHLKYQNPHDGCSLSSDCRGIRWTILQLRYGRRKTVFLQIL